MENTNYISGIVLAREVACLSQSLKVSITYSDFHKSRVEHGHSESDPSNPRGSARLAGCSYLRAKNRGDTRAMSEIHNCFVSRAGFLARNENSSLPKRRTKRPIADYATALLITRAALKELMPTIALDSSMPSIIDRLDDNGLILDERDVLIEYLTITNAFTLAGLSNHFKSLGFKDYSTKEAVAELAIRVIKDLNCCGQTQLGEQLKSAVEDYLFAGGKR
ncbi:hypothetical protein ACNUDM_11745 [Vibrio chaetopteri]|uniref:hypothetical protein n=1 Tax=Vibrio chaetopteri TaxID=3016528 RepID=UPI003AB5DB82